MPIPTDATVDLGSSTMISTLLSRGNGTTIVTWEAWSVPLYFADSSTPRYTVQFDRFHFGGMDFLDNVPIPDGALEDPGSSSGTDGHMTVIDVDSGCLYDLFEAHKEGDTWFAGWANRLDADSDGIYPEGASCRGSGFSNMLGVIRPNELLGEIEHALVFSCASNRSGGPVPPATESDGANAGSEFIPEGARLRLRPDFDLSPYPEWQQKIGRALKKYGCLDGDNGGSTISFYAQNTKVSPVADGAGTAWPWGTTKYPSVPSAFIENLEVLELPAQVPSQANPLPHRCGDFG